MKFNLKNYQTQKTREYLKNNNFILFSINANQSAQNWVVVEQGLQKLKLNYYKVYNKAAKKIVEQSVNLNVVNMINSTFFFLKPINGKTLIKTNLLSSLNSILFSVLTLKLNRKIYTIAQSKNINSFHYKKNVAILYQFLLTNLKTTYSLKKS